MIKDYMPKVYLLDSKEIKYRYLNNQAILKLDGLNDKKETQYY